MISGDRERYSRIFRIPMQISQDTLNLHLESIVIDAHCDSMGRELEGRRLLKDYSTLGQWDFPRAAVGGLTTEFLATFVSPERGGGGVRQTMQFIDIFHRGIEDNSDTIVQVLRADDIRTAKQTGKLGLMLSMEGAEGLEGDLRVLRNCYRLGLRCLGLTWNRRNEAADGLAESSTGGLESFLILRTLHQKGLRTSWKFTKVRCLARMPTVIRCVPTRAITPMTC